MQIITDADRGSGGSFVNNTEGQPSVSNDGQNVALTENKGNEKSFQNKAFQTSETDVSSFPTKNTKQRKKSSMKLNEDSEEFLALRHNYRISVHRRVADYNYMEKKYGLLPQETFSETIVKVVKSKCSCSKFCFQSFLKSVIPIFEWCPKYQAKFFLMDLMAGITISIIHIPQGMAYGLLATLKAENGLYVSFFPVLVYFVFGTSRHISVGTFAVVSLMTSTTIDNFNLADSTNNLNSTQSSDSLYSLPTRLEVATSLAIAVGFWQLVLGVCHLGALSVMLSDQLISGFTTGAACHVATSQIADLFGISISRHPGILKLIYMWKDLLTQMLSLNINTLIISVISLIIILFVKDFINARYKEKLPIPVPIELIMVIALTLVSYLMNFNTKYSVKIMGNIPTGLPSPVVPRMDLIPHLLMDSFALSVVVFAISVSMAKLFAKKHKYEIRPNQELLALGFANVFSSFFSCYPCSISLSRSLVQERAGGHTQIASVISCLILLLVLLVLAPLFHFLPKCILSCIILVAVKAMFSQIFDFTKAWKISKIDGLIWLVTFLSTVFLDVSYGLLIGVVFSFCTVAARTFSPLRMVLGNVPGTDLYLDVERFQEATEIKGIKIFRFESALYFINKELYKNLILELVPIKSKEEGSVIPLNGIEIEENNIERKESNTEKKESDIKEKENDIERKNNKKDLRTVENESDDNNGIHHIILDCAPFSYVDVSGLETLSEIIREYSEVGIVVYLSGCSVAMCDMMERAKFSESVPHKPFAFPTIHDAVRYSSE